MKKVKAAVEKVYCESKEGKLISRKILREIDEVTL